MTECKDKCWCKKYPRNFSDMYEALRPLHDSLYEYVRTVDALNTRIGKCEKSLFSRNPHKCPICLGKRVVEYVDVVGECRTCNGTGIVWG